MQIVEKYLKTIKKLKKTKKFIQTTEKRLDVSLKLL
jgi:Mn-dependent DtxR family transcriptional regulator